MKGKRFFTILLVSFLGLALAGCTGGSSSGTQTGSLGTFNGGDKAVEFDFASGQPPERVRDGGLQPFSVRVEVENVGEYDIPEGEAHVALTGIDPSSFGLEDVSQDLGALRGVKKQGSNIIPGARQQVAFTNLFYKPELPSGTVPQTIYANICYPYQTRSVATICISGDTYQDIDDESIVCKTDGLKEFANSGAPVKIENVRQDPGSSSSVLIQFDIVHKPSNKEGRVFKSGVLDQDCRVNGLAASSTQADIEEDYVTYTVETGIPGIECNAQGTNTETVLLSEDTNRYTVFCEQDTTGQSEYEKPITITLKYDYLERQKKEITIEHVSR